jgi:hypothetical protein
MVCFSGFAQTASDDLVSLQAKQQRLDLVLKDIARQTNKTFSYTSSTINVEQKITISITRKPLKEALDLIFENRIAYKIKGKYIILSPQSPPKDELRKITIRGYIKDKETRQNIAYASIYESSQLVASLSNQNGYFEMKLSATESPQRIALTVSKQQYWSEDVRLLGNQDQFLNVNLLSQRLDSIHSVGGEIDPNKIPKEDIPWVIENLSRVYFESVDDRTRNFVVLAIGSMNNPLALPVLNKALEDSDSQVRFNAVTSIGNMTSTENIEWNKVEALISQEQDPGLRQVALLALAAHNRPNIEEKALPFLQSSEKNLRHAAAVVLISKKNERVIPVLEEILGLRYDVAQAGELNGAQVEGLKVNVLENIEKSKWNALVKIVAKVESEDTNIRVSTKAKQVLKVLKN